MENLTNEQIVDIINFYKLCGITDDMYLSRDGVLDLFTLLGIKPEYDEEGNRVPTVYEQLSIAPLFRDKKEVPIVFAIKHKVSKVAKPKVTQTYSFVGGKEKAIDDIILKKFREDYFSALANGNMNEASRLYDFIDKMTGGKADMFIGVQYECVKFYKKMQKQLLIDMFANFVILMVLSKKQAVKDGIIKFDKLYKAFVEKELKNDNFGLSIGGSSNAFKISNITINVSDESNSTKTKVKVGDLVEQKKRAQDQTLEPKVNAETQKSGFVSFVKSKINQKLEKFRDNLSKKIKQENNELNKSIKEKSSVAEIAVDKNFNINILENN